MRAERYRAPRSAAVADPRAASCVGHRLPATLRHPVEVHPEKNRSSRSGCPRSPRRARRTIVVRRTSPKVRLCGQALRGHSPSRTGHTPSPAARFHSVFNTARASSKGPALEVIAAFRAGLYAVDPVIEGGLDLAPRALALLCGRGKVNKLPPQRSKETADVGYHQPGRFPLSHVMVASPSRHGDPHRGTVPRSSRSLNHLPVFGAYDADRMRVCAKTRLQLSRKKTGWTRCSASCARRCRHGLFETPTRSPATWPRRRRVDPAAAPGSSRKCVTSSHRPPARRRHRTRRTGASHDALTCLRAGAPPPGAAIVSVAAMSGVRSRGGRYRKQLPACHPAHAIRRRHLREGRSHDGHFDAARAS